ncbi:homing endonuclease associated repeat-containing protein [Halostagnicola bangensis]
MGNGLRLFIYYTGTKPSVTTVENCLTALRRASEKLGESPSKAQYEELGWTPASATIIRTLGSWNEAKAAAGLETYSSGGSRVESKPDELELPDGMVWKELTVDQRWHYRHVERNTERTLQRRRRLRKWLNHRKHVRGCPQCSIDTAQCLDFHHADPSEKTMSVCRMVTYGYGRDALQDELSHCVVLCANCHRKRHYDPPTRECRRIVHEQKRKTGGCESCSEDDPAALDYHHVDEKRSTVAELISDNRSMERIRTEIDHCIVLCANCHRIEHGHSRTSGT